MSLFKSIRKVAKWVTRQKHHPGIAELERAVPILGVIERVAEDVLRLRSSFDDRHLRGLAIETLRKRAGREPGVAEVARLVEELRKRGVG